MTHFKEIDAKTLKSWLDKSEAELIDVRGTAEHNSEAIKGSESHPLDDLCAHPESLNIPKSKKLVVCCLSGMRSKKACDFLKEHHDELWVLDGGITAWKQEGFPVETTGKKLFPMFQQIQIVSGSMILLTLAMAYFVNPRFVALTAVIGAMQIFSGASGWCGMSGILMKMPWNKS